MRVAILQSDPQHRFVIGEIIERLGHVCIPFSDGLSMSKSLSRSTVDMLVLDWHSAGLSGLDLLKSMRSGEFGARVAALLWRAYPANTAAITELGPYRFDSRQQSVTVRGQPVQLSGTQFRLALLFFSNIGRVLSRDHILAMVWGREFRETTRTIDSHVSRLRLALTIEPINHFRLQPVYKSGYRLLHLYGDSAVEAHMQEEATA
ncbi:response regulator transcription factor [Caballeronia sp. SEWSISQ10-4 2]|uniref:response regulator transcription factor n=1 Tax=Caballeronia sp. SEWSISQ10-4 2 TaxID=2937438 RepID=UPI002651FDEE|nr:response regulator transcription factor [Caballeronia sp. SEWSISQ10-4 2]MDN7179312.1 response regulator transcription factor [Caballeronia sp. SEWSISQ10-4 2]